MNTITIPKKSFAKGDLVIVPRAEYESLKARQIPEVAASKAQLRALARMRKNRVAGKLIPLDVLERDLARRS